MKSSIAKLKTITNHGQDPAALAWDKWATPLASLGITPETVPEPLREYLTTCLFKKPLNLTFTLYSLAQLQTFMAKDEFAQLSAAAGYFIIGDRDGTFVCASLKDDSVAMIDGWAITEGKFTKEKKYKSLETFFRGRLKHERQAAKEAAEDDAEKAANKERLASAGDVNAVDADGCTLLMLACSDNDLDSVRALLARGADPNVSGKRPALFRAVQVRNPELVSVLLEHGAKLTWDGATREPLELAATKGNLDVVKKLVAAGADVHGQPPHTPLSRAVGDNNLEITEYLLEQGADPNVVLDDVGSRGPRTALSLTTRNPPMMQLLLARGADPRACPKIFTGCISSGDLDDTARLLDAGAILDSTDLHRCRTPEMVELLLDAGGDANAVSYHRTPLIEFARITKMSPKKERPPLMAIMRLLLERGADVNLQDGLGNTALHIAIDENNGEGAQLVLEFQPDVSITNNAGKLAADLLPSVRPKALRLEIQAAIEKLTSA